MKKWTCIICMSVLLLSISGCGSSFEPSISSLYVQKDGTLTYAVVESFEKDYYSLNEFQSMIEREVDTCNSMYSEPAITINQVEVKDGTLYLLLEFVNAEAYSNYNEEYCFVGTIEEALEEGRSFDMVFKDTKYEEYTTAEVTDKKENHVLIVQSEGVVELEAAVKYASNNVEILSERMVEVMPMADEEEYAYIIY